MDYDSSIMVSEDQLHEISDELEMIPHLSAKMLADLVSGHKDSKDLLESKKNQGMLGKFIGALDGSKRRSEIIIQEQNHRSVEVLTSWALNLTESMRSTQENLNFVADKLLQTRGDLIKVAKLAGQNQDQILLIENQLKALDNRLSQQIIEAQQRLLKVEDKQEIDYLIEAWVAGNHYYIDYPTPVQIAFLIDDLMRGERGQRIHKSPVLLDYLYNRIVNTYELKSNKSKDKPQRLSSQWLPELEFQNDLKREVTSYGLQIPQAMSLHNAIAEYALRKRNPEWLQEGQERGVLPEIMDARLFTEHLIHEAATKAA